MEKIIQILLLISFSLSYYINQQLDHNLSVIFNFCKLNLRYVYYKVKLRLLKVLLHWNLSNPPHKGTSEMCRIGQDVEMRMSENSGVGLQKFHCIKIMYRGAYCLYLTRSQQFTAGQQYFDTHVMNLKQAVIVLKFQKNASYKSEVICGFLIPRDLIKSVHVFLK